MEPNAAARLLTERRNGHADHSRMLDAIAMFSCWWAQRKNG